MSDNNSQETPPNLPPQPPPITDRDRGIFKERLQRILKEKDTSGRRLEDKIGMATGTLSKLYNGRVALSLKMLREIGTALDTPPQQLVEGTALAHLLMGAPDLPKFAELEEARGEIDRLRADGAERDATINGLHGKQIEMQEELTSLRKDLAAAQLAQKEAEKKYTETTTALRNAETAAEERSVTIKRLEREVHAKRKQLDETNKVIDSNKSEIERLTSENDSKNSTIKDLQKQLAGATKRADDATRTAEKNAVEVKDLKSKLALSEKQRQDAAERASAAEENGVALRQEREALNARLAETTNARDAWRTEAINRRQREEYYNAEITRLNATVQQKDSAEGIKLLLTGLGTLGLGMAIGSENKRSRR